MNEMSTEPVSNIAGAITLRNGKAVLTGEKYGRLTIKSFGGKNADGRQQVTAACECGTEKAYLLRELLRGNTSSCGCLHREITANRNRTHDRSKTPEYRSWKGMLNRCSNPHCSKYARYGGRGIKVCERWMSFGNFFADMGLKPSPLHSIERENNDGNYEPDNCKWATNREQSWNRRTNSWITVNGVRMIITEAARKTGIPQSTLSVKITLTKKRGETGFVHRGFRIDIEACKLA